MTKSQKEDKYQHNGKKGRNVNKNNNQTTRKLPEPYGKIQYKTSGKVLGGIIINMDGSTKQAIRKRLQGAKQNW